jgi:hypothetical protein
MNKGKLAEDPRGLLFEAYRITGITLPECKTIFLDWALGLDINMDQITAIKSALKEYQRSNSDHPMTKVLIEGLNTHNQPKKRRGGSSARRT